MIARYAHGGKRGKVRWPRRVSRRGRPPTGREVGRHEPRGSRLCLIGAKYRNKGCGITHL